MSSAGCTSVLVIGGGVAGCSVAIDLARAGVATTVVDKGDREGWRVGETIPPNARPILEGLGVWDGFRAGGHLAASGSRSSWGSPELADKDFIFNAFGCGWHLDRDRFDHLLAAAAQEAGAVWCDRSAVVDVHRADGGDWEVVVDGAGRGCTTRAAMVVDAGGRTSPFRAWSGARLRTCDRMVAVAGLLEPEPDGGIGLTDGPVTSLVEAVENGWWYAATVPGGRVVAVYFTGSPVPIAPLRSPEAWLGLLGRTVHVAGAAGADRARLVGPLRVQAAGSSWLEPAAGDRWLAVGDAAASVDPLSSQGIMAAMASGRAAATAVLARLGGEHEAPGRYDAAARAAYARYIVQRCSYYRLERRWPESPFWRRRWALPEVRRPDSPASHRTVGRPT